MSSPAATYCAGCGRPLGLDPIGTGDSLACPRCPARLTAFSGAPGKLYDCGGCGGQFVEHTLIRALLERREICGTAVPRRTERARRQGSAVRYVPCPACGALMNRQNFGVTSGIIVDICGHHGVWFEEGELPRVLDFVEKGGLERARRRREAESPQKRPPSAIDTAHRGALVGHASPPAWASGSWDDIKAVVATVLRDLGESLERR